MERGLRLTMTNKSTHALGVLVPRREQSPYAMGRGECPYPRRTRQSLSDGREENVPIPRGEESMPIPRGECPYPKRRGEGPYPKRRRDCLTTWERRADCHAQHIEREGLKFT